MTGIRLITFDLDDTLWAVEPVIERANQVLCNWLAQNVPQMTTGVPVRDLNTYRDQVLASEPELGQFVTRLRLRILQRMLEDAGVGGAERDAIAKAAFEEFLHARHAVKYHRHALDLLDELAANYTTAALSNGNADVHRLEIGQHFDFAISAESAGAGKPDPAMFHQACERAGCEPGEVLHIGDHPEHDVLGAIQSGMHAIWVNLSREPWKPDFTVQPTAEVRCLSEIPAALRDLEQRLRNQ